MKQIRSHTGLRGVAALLVLAYHLQYVPGHLALEDATTFFRRCYLMVDLFFVLSGFIIAYVYDINQSIVMTAGEMKTFLLRRFIRIYPLHFLVLIVFVVYNLSMTAVFVSAGRAAPVDWSARSLTMLGAQFVLLNAWMPGPNGWNIPSWSISAEFVAYLLFPVMVLAAAKRPRACFAIMAILVVAFYVLGPVRGSLDVTGGVGAPLRCLAGFTAGFLIHAYRSSFATLGSTASSIVQVAAVAWIATMMIAPVADSYVVLGFMVLVGTTWTDRGVVAQALSGRYVEWLGEISFAVYISHVFLINAFNFVWERSGRRLIGNPDLERSCFLIGAFTLVVLVSSIVYIRVERPIRGYLTRRWTPSVSKPR